MAFVTRKCQLALAVNEPELLCTILLLNTGSIVRSVQFCKYSGSLIARFAENEY